MNGPGVRGPTQWVCPSCRGELEGVAQLTCSRCAAVYPVVGRQLPVLLENPYAAITDAYLGLLIAGKSAAKSVDALAENQRPVFGAQGPVQQGYRSQERAHRTLANNLHLSTEARRFLDSLWATSHAKPVEKPTLYTDPLLYGDRDWGGSESGEAEIERIMSRVADYSKHTTDRASVLVVGAGVGRFSHELLGLYANVAAVEKSVSMGILYETVQSEVFSYSLVELKNTKTPEEFVRSVALSKSRTQRSPMRADARVSYAAANATQLPVASGSQSAVASLFFTDVVPLPKLLGECRRVLRPGGLFIHCGPLHYHFDEQAHFYAATEVKQVLADAGFAVIEESWSPGFHLERPGAMTNRWYDCWNFVARRGPELQLPDAADRPLQFATNFRLDTPTVYVGGDAQERPASLTLPDGTRLQVDAGVVAVLGQVNGHRSFNGLVEHLAGEYEVDEPTRQKLADAITRLILQGILRFG